MTMYAKPNDDNAPEVNLPEVFWLSCLTLYSIFFSKADSNYIIISLFNKLM